MNVCIGVKSAVFCYSRLVTVYLAASDLFLHEDIRILIRQCLTDILKSRRSLVFKASRLPGIDSFEVHKSGFTYFFTKEPLESYIS